MRATPNEDARHREIPKQLNWPSVVTRGLGHSEDAEQRPGTATEISPTDAATPARSAPQRLRPGARSGCRRPVLAGYRRGSAHQPTDVHVISENSSV